MIAIFRQTKGDDKMNDRIDSVEDIPSEFECLSPRNLTEMILMCKVCGVVAAVRWYCEITDNISISLSAAEWLASRAEERNE